jgi:hypothetical protein
MADDSNSLGELKVTIGADTTPLEASSPKVQKILNDMASKAASQTALATAKIIGAWTAAAGTVYKVADAVRDVINEADQLGKTSQALGIPVTALARLQYAAEGSNVSVDDLGVSMKFLANIISQHGGLETGPIIFSQLGISVKDAAGKLKSADVVLGELADKLSRYADGPQKTAIAWQLLGKQGPQLLDLLNKGSAGIKALGDQGVRTGAVFSEDLVKKSAEFNDTLDLLKGQIGGTVQVLAASLLPALQFLADSFKNSEGAGLGLKIVALAIGDVFKLLLVSIEGIVRGFAGLAIVVATTAKAVSDAAHGNFADAWKTIKGGFNELADGLHAWGEDTRSIFGNTIGEWQTSTNDFSTKVAAPIIRTAEDIKNALENILSDSSVDPAVKIAKLNAALRAGTITWAEYGSKADNALAPLKDLANSETSDAISQNILSISQQMAVLNKAVASGTIGFRQYDKMVQSVYENQKNAVLDVASETATVLTQVFGQNKAAAIASAIINTAVGITKALSAYPPPYNFAMAALVAASGAAQLAAIRSTSSTGGGGAAPSASTGTGSAGASAPAAAAPTQTLNVVGIDRNSLFTGDAVRGIAQSLIDYQKDGGRVILN